MAEPSRGLYVLVYISLFMGVVIVALFSQRSVKPIRGFAKLLREGNVNEEEKEEYLKIIIEESERLEELATNILTLSKIEHTEIVSEQSRFDLSEQIRLAIIVLEPKRSLKSLLLDIELDEAVTIYGNKNMLQQVWMNLLDNAIKYSNQESKIQVSLVREGQEVLSRF